VLERDLSILSGRNNQRKDKGNYINFSLFFFPIEKEILPHKEAVYLYFS